MIEEDDGQTSMHVSLPKALREFVDERVKDGLYASASEYIRELIRNDREHWIVRKADAVRALAGELTADRGVRRGADQSALGETMTLPKTIVAEVSKTWINGHGVELPGYPDLLSGRFQYVIKVNDGRHYRLRDWQLCRVVIEDSINETIIAVFEHDPRST